MARGPDVSQQPTNLDLEVGALPRDRELHVRRRISLLAVGISSYLLATLLSTLPNLTEAVYGSFVGPSLSLVVSLITGWVPIALGELIVLAIIVRQLVGGTMAVRDVARRTRRAKNAIACGALRIGQDLGILVALFYLLWGFHYSRPALEQRLAWELPSAVSLEELSDLIEQLVSAANESYLEIHNSEDAGVATVFPAGRTQIEGPLRDGWVAGRRELGLPAHSRFYGRVKTPLLTRWYEWVGVAGYYFPYTGEANLRAGVPGVDVPKMLAHEMAHQRGVAREAEANFWGFIAAAHAPHPYARYSAFVFAQRQLMIGLMLQDPERLSELVRMRLPGVQRDIDDAREYWRSFRGAGTRIGTALNDAYLRSNRVHGGVENYSRSALLFIAYAKARAGQVVPSN